MMNRFPLNGRLAPLAGAIALGVAMAAAYLMASAGTSTMEAESNAAVTVTTVAQEDAENTEEMQEVLTSLPVETYAVYLSRDPFKPLTVVASGGTGGGTDGGGTDGGGTGGGGTGVVTGCSTAGEEAVCEGIVVSLIDVFTDGSGVEKARIQVDSVLYEVVDDQLFANNFVVLAIDAPCVTLLFGDDTFQLCEGDVILK